MVKRFLIALLVFVLATLYVEAAAGLGEVKISPEWGRITERFDAKGGGNKLIIHIQDAHTNYEAQKNAASIIEDLIKRHGLYLILVEGGSRDVTLNRYREEYTLEQRKQMAEESLKNGVIAGEEYLNIISDYPMKLQGIEDRALYDQNMAAFLEIDKGKDAALLYARLLSGVVSDLKAKVYSKALKEFDEKRRGFKEEKVGLNEYVNYLSELVQSKRIDILSYSNYKNLMDSVGLEKAIDFEAVEKERADAIDVLSKKIDKDALNELLTKSVDFKAGKLTPAQYHNYLRDTMTRMKLGIQQYPNLERYIRYITTYERIDSAGLFKELKSIEMSIEHALAVNEGQGRLAKIARHQELLTEFVNLKLSPDDFDYYVASEADFDVDVWVRFLNDQAARFKLAQKVPENPGAIEKLIPSLKQFYTIARKRDEVFLNNTRKYMDEESANMAVLIAGGFHTPSLTRLFRENDISYLVVSPKVLKPTDEKLYHKILTEGWAPAGGLAPETE